MQIKKSTNDYSAHLIERVKRINKLITRENFTKPLLMQPRADSPFFFLFPIDTMQKRRRY